MMCVIAALCCKAQNGRRPGPAAAGRVTQPRAMSFSAAAGNFKRPATPQAHPLHEHQRLSQQAGLYLAMYHHR